MIQKNLGEILKGDLDFLLSAPVSEGKTIEYKSVVTIVDEKSKLKFVKGISAFANSSGGDFLVGIHAENGIPKAYKGIPASEIDGIILKLDQIIKAGIDPRPHIDFKPIPLSNSESVLLLRIAKSWQPPHMVTLGGHNSIYGRSSAGKYPLAISEIKALALNSLELAEKVKRFQAERILKIRSNETNHILTSAGKIVLHLIPTNFLSNGISIDFEKSLGAIDYMLSPLGPGGFDFKINLDGVSYFSNRRDEEVVFRYTQLFRSGAIESVLDQITSTGERTLPSRTYEFRIIEFLNSIKKKFQRLGIEFPIYVFLSFVNFKGYSLGVSPDAEYLPYPCPDDVVLVPNVEWKNETENVATMLRPIFDTVWNTFGQPKSLNYDANGNWK